MPYKRTPLTQPHQKKVNKKQPQTGRTVNNSKKYQTQKWRRFRKRCLELSPLCVHCKAKGETTAANVLDHIIPIRLGGEMYAVDNVQTLCNSCHNKKSAKERHLEGYAPSITKV